MIFGNIAKCFGDSQQYDGGWFEAVASLVDTAIAEARKEERLWYNNHI